MPYLVFEKYLMWLFYSSNNLGWFACFRIQFLPDHIMIHSCLVCVSPLTHIGTGQNPGTMLFTVQHMLLQWSSCWDVVNNPKFELSSIIWYHTFLY